VFAGIVAFFSFFLDTESTKETRSDTKLDFALAFLVFFSYQEVSPMY